MDMSQKSGKVLRKILITEKSKVFAGSLKLKQLPNIIMDILGIRIAPLCEVAAQIQLAIDVRPYEPSTQAEICG